MTGFVIMFKGVLVFRRLAASHMAASHADSEMHPGISGFEAVLATLGACGYRVHFIRVIAYIRI
jgi:hypothetical protein